MKRQMTFSGKTLDMIHEALIDAAVAAEDIDDPRHYTQDDLDRIAARAAALRRLADRISGKNS